MEALIQKELDKRERIKFVLQRIHSEIKIGSDNVTIDPLTLFLRLVVVVERKLEDEIGPYPMSLFEDGITRSARRAKLKSLLLQDVPKIDQAGSKSIADGGALLWCCDWKRNKRCENIFKKYVNFFDLP